MQETQRRLAAIVAADVVGYSRLMGADETGTLAALRKLRADLVDPAISGHGGRIVKTMGDGLLLEFPSVVDAVKCAVAVQRAMTAHTATVSDDRAIRYRIGIHIGDIIIEGDDIFGDGVNIAARVEPLAQTGGICLSDDAYRQVRDRVDIAWTDGGTHQVKNIARPLQVWRWQHDAGPSMEPVQPAPLPLPDKPSIAVLPFNNMSGDPEQDYFADGMTEDLITDLSKISSLFVVARNSCFAFKGQAVDVRDAARRLGVRYVLEGSVRKAGPRVRINAQLIDATSGGHLWADRYDGAIEDVFELQDEVGAKVVSALAVHLTGDEQRRLNQVHTRNLEAYELFVRAKSTPYPPLPERLESARKMFEQVIDLDPDFAGGHAGVSWILSFGAMFGHADISPIAERAVALSEKAISLDESFGMGHVAAALALQLKGKHDEAIAAADAAVERQPNDADAHALRGLVLAFAGQAGRGLAPIEHAIRLNPQFVNSPFRNLRSCIMLLAQDYEGSARSFEENVQREGPVGPPVLCWAAASYTAVGRKDDATRARTELAARFPAFRLTGWNFPKLIKSPEHRARYIDLMNAAEVPT